MTHAQPKIQFTLVELAQMTGSKLIGQENHLIEQVEDLESAKPTDASFLANRRYESLMKKSQAGVIFIEPRIVLIEGRNFLINDNPSAAFQIVVEAFYPPSRRESGFKGIHPSAVIHPEAILGDNVNVGPHVVIDARTSIGDNTTIGPGVSIGPEVSIGKNCHFYANVVIREGSIIGHRVIIQPGAVIGSCGFGYTTDNQGIHTQLKQVGNIVIEDDVEIGANTTIDRARFKTTRVSKGTKIDNLVQIAHGVSIGEHNLIVAQTGIAGSSKTGKHVILAGQSAMVGHITLADGVILTGRCAASKSLPKGTYSGFPAQPSTEHNRQLALIRNLEKYIKKIDYLEKKLDNQLH